MHKWIRRASGTSMAVIGVLLGMGAEPLSAAPGPEEGRPTLVRVAKPPQIDGTMGGEEWAEAHPLGKLRVRDGAAMPGTHAWIAMDESSLYIAFRCDEPTPEKIKTAALAYEDNQPVWDDDSVEVYIDPGNTGQSVYRLVSNAEGTLFAAHVVNRQQLDTPWESGASVKTSKGATSWEVEIAIPVSALRHELRQGEVFSVNVGRTRHAGDRQPQYASLTSGGQFLFTEQYVPLVVFGPVKMDGLEILSTKRGPFFEEEAGVWEFEVASGKATPDTKLVAHFPGKEVPIPLTGGSQVVSIPFSPGEAAAYKECTLKLGSRELYAARYQVEDLAVPPQVAITRDPLFEELIEAVPTGLSKEGVMMWTHDLSPLTRNLARRTGSEYSEDLMMKHYAENNSIRITRSLPLTPEWTEFSLKHGVKGMIDLRIPRDEKVERRWQQHPAAERVYLERARTAIEHAKTSPFVWGLFAGDENWEANESTLRWILNNKRKGFTPFQNADREVREKYGFGKFGLPRSGTDQNPYAWIATRRWEIDRMLAVQEEIREQVKKEAPHLKMISWDNYPGHYPRAIGRWGKVFDVITFQLYPSRNHNIEELGFVTKWMADLSGREEIWPCPHVEHYAGNFTAEEVEELLSQTFKNGATGLHVYASDTIGRRAGVGTFSTERIGAPERWAVMQSVFERLKEPFRVKQPKPDAGIFYSNTSYQGQPGLRKTREVEWLYMILGPRLHGAFKFFEELLCEEAPEKLEEFKVIYVPYAPIVDDLEYNALRTFAENGGTLVICDPLAFRNRSDGSERTIGPILPPLESTQTLGAQSLLISRDGGEKKLAAMGAAYVLKSKGTVLATYADQQPAIIETSLGKGKVIFFGENPLQSNVTTNQEWLDLFSWLQKREGVSMGHSVWRFRFPKTPPLPSSRPSGVCLTGNYFEWSLSKPQLVANAKVRGSYQLSRTDESGLEAAHQETAFEKGRLSDRWRGVAAPNDADVRDFQLTWKLDEPLTITYRFDATVTPRMARIYFSDLLPEGRCEISQDGETWQDAGEWASEPATSEILPWMTAAEANERSIGLKNIELPGKAATFLRFHFLPKEGKKLTLVELDVWGEE